MACARLVGQTIASGDELQARLAHFKGNPFAKAALDTAWWSLHANFTGRPLHGLLAKAAGRWARSEVAVGADFGVMDSIDDLLAGIGQAVETGFPRMKLKFRPGWDLPMLRASGGSFPSRRFTSIATAATRWPMCRFSSTSMS